MKQMIVDVFSFSALTGKIMLMNIKRSEFFDDDSIIVAVIF
jgi:hypothetical protein